VVLIIRRWRGASGPQRTADHRHDARTRGQGVAPRPGHGQREVTDSSRSLRGTAGASIETARAENCQLVPGPAGQPASSSRPSLVEHQTSSSRPRALPSSPQRRGRKQRRRRTPPALHWTTDAATAATASASPGNREKCGVIMGAFCHAPRVAHHPNGNVGEKIRIATRIVRRRCSRGGGPSPGFCPFHRGGRGRGRSSRRGSSFGTRPKTVDAALVTDGLVHESKERLRRPLLPGASGG